MQTTIALWMTRNITEDIPGWGALFHGRAGDGTVSVSNKNIRSNYTFGPFVMLNFFLLIFTL